MGYLRLKCRDCGYEYLEARKGSDGLAVTDYGDGTLYKKHEGVIALPPICPSCADVEVMSRVYDMVEELDWDNREKQVSDEHKELLFLLDGFRRKGADETQIAFREEYEKKVKGIKQSLLKPEDALTELVIFFNDLLASNCEI